MRNPKITVIGAGSESFGLTNLGAIMRTPQLAGSTLALCDKNEEGLKKIVTLARRISNEWGSDIKIESSVKSSDVIPGSDFVIISVAIDREKCWLMDHELGKKYGIIHYAENGGPGGFFHGARNIALVHPILKEIEKLAPNAFVLNFTNPMTRICTLASHYTKVEMVGICHQIDFGHIMIARILAGDLGLDVNSNYLFRWGGNGEDDRKLISAAEERVDVLAAGINHFTWFRSIRDKQTGEELFPLFKKRFLEQTVFEPYTRDIIRLFDECPVSGDAHLLEYLPYTSNPARGGWERYDIQMFPLTGGDKTRNEMWDNISDMAAGKKDIEPLRHVQTERAESIIAAVWHGENLYDMAVNIPNTQHVISNLPVDAVVEVPAVLGLHGVKGVSMGDLPPIAAEFCNRQKIIVDLAVKAAVEGDRVAAVQALALDPMVDDLSVAERIVEEGLALNKAYLPAFS